MKNLSINPNGLKGREINERMIELMGIKPIVENRSNYAVELTKLGPDGKAYAIVRENKNYFIKVSTKTSDLVTEDFKYIGGLQNKMTEAYSSYEKAKRNLSVSFKSLAEANGKVLDINISLNDNLLREMATGAAFSSENNNGFSGVGNLDGNQDGIDYDDENFSDPFIDDEDETYGLTEEELAIDAMIETEDDMLKKKVV